MRPTLQMSAGVRRASSLARWYFAVLLLLAGGCHRDPSITIVAADGTKRATVEVEIADKPLSREIGLMYRKSMPENSGMIFLFPAPGHLSFWMKNTEIPLDMIFADKDRRVVGIVSNAVPYSEKPVGPNADFSQYVLEVNGGFSAAHKIVPGDKFEFAGFDGNSGR